MWDPSFILFYVILFYIIYFIHYILFSMYFSISFFYFLFFQILLVQLHKVTCVYKLGQKYHIQCFLKSEHND